MDGFNDSEEREEEEVGTSSRDFSGDQLCEESWLQLGIGRAREPFLPQISKSYLRIKDGRMTIRLLKKYLVSKLGLEDESEVEISCRGQRLLPLLTLQHVRDNIWQLHETSTSLTLVPESSRNEHLMTLQYGRSS
ncbi:E3 ubiquitin protein ligase DRIP1 [Platanthera guangdongensis]|uniref:E3 ubiquitin protein ligase DRIP1 n=1 Tax=Platanthera guangdongensis TaxID=2320717 RepID=A0ABR2LHJ8_9ASPA